MKSLLERGKAIRTEMPVHIPTADGKAIAETIMVTVDAIKDPRTGEVYLSGEALEELSRVKARHMGLLLPSEIQAMRERLGFTQKEMSELLAIGDKSYTRWETGRERPSKSMNRLLVALWEGRLSIGDLQAMRQPVFSWFEQLRGFCPCGAEHRPAVIATTVRAGNQVHDEVFSAAA
jgi:DNA-binding transcriptional regulator YiaG